VTNNQPQLVTAKDTPMLNEGMGGGYL